MTEHRFEVGTLIRYMNNALWLRELRGCTGRVARVLEDGYDIHVHPGMYNSGNYSQYFLHATYAHNPKLIQVVEELPSAKSDTSVSSLKIANAPWDW